MPGATTECPSRLAELRSRRVDGETIVDSGDRGRISAGVRPSRTSEQLISETTGGNVDALRQVPVCAVFDDSAKQTGSSSSINHFAREVHLILH